LRGKVGGRLRAENLHILERWYTRFRRVPQKILLMKLFKSLVLTAFGLCLGVGSTISNVRALDSIDSAAKTVELEKIKQLTAQIRLEPKQALLYAKRGQCYVRMKEWENALIDTNAALELNPNVGLFYLARGSIYKELGKHDLEKLDLEHAVTLSPDDVQCLKKLAALYSMNNRDLDACNLFSKAISIKGDSAELYWLRAETFIAMRNFAKANTDCDQAERLAPGNEEVLVVRREIKRLEGQKPAQR